MKKLTARLVSSSVALSALLLMLSLVGGPQTAAAQEVDLTGDWVLTVESPNGTGTRDVTFLQEGDELTGDIASTQAAGPLTGKVDGNKVTFIAIVMMDSGPFEITYAGTITGNEIEGTVEFGSYGGGTFTGRRVEDGGGSR